MRANVAAGDAGKRVKAVYYQKSLGNSCQFDTPGGICAGGGGGSGIMKVLWCVG